jgi:hypothetical protein
MKTDDTEARPAASPESVPASNATPTIQHALEGVTTVIVAVHGIGSQRRSDTVRSVAARFASSLEPALPTQPLGFFRVDDAAQLRISRLPNVAAGNDGPEPPSRLQQLGFAEVYWADIPRQAVEAMDTLEETKAWAKSVVSRAHAMYKQNVASGVIADEDFALGAGVIEEIIETIAVLENLLLLADKAGVFKFDVGPILRDYLGDVQIVAEFVNYRALILGRFHRAMNELLSKLPKGVCPDIYIVAHSEGSVVSFLAMLQALAAREVDCPRLEPPKPGSSRHTEKVSTAWIDHVRGYMTIGSPIDKHLALWEGLWSDVKNKLGGARRERIRWRNYYDYGDPIGFELDGARRFLEGASCEAFEFEPKHDIGYSRSFVPGAAHNAYWADKDVFEHFLYNVIYPEPTHGRAEPSRPRPDPKNRFLRGPISTAIPYAVSALLHVAAVFVLFNAMAAFADSAVSRGATARITGLLSLFLVGITVAARLPRLVARSAYSLYWPMLSLFVFGCGAAAYHFFMYSDFKAEVVSSLGWSVAETDPSWRRDALPIAMAALVAVSGWIVPREPGRARKVLLGSGALLVGTIAVNRLAATNSDQPVWPVLLGGVGFLYLWWLAILLFDLAFVWHRYIRSSVGLYTLRRWQQRKDVDRGVIRNAMSRVRRGLE